MILPLAAATRKCPLCKASATATDDQTASLQISYTCSGCKARFQVGKTLTEEEREIRTNIRLFLANNPEWKELAKAI